MQCTWRSVQRPAASLQPTMPLAFRSNTVTLRIKPKCSPTLTSIRTRWLGTARCTSGPEQKIPEQLSFGSDDSSERAEMSSSSSMEYDEETKTLRIPLSASQGDGGTRRTRLVTFTCNKCGERTQRAVNPIAWEKGVVYGQCSSCSVWHVLAANNPLIYEEIVYKDLEAQELAAAAEQEQAGNGAQQP